MSSPPDGAPPPPSGIPTDEAVRLHPAVLGVWAWQRILPLALILLLTGALPGVGSFILLLVLGSMGVQYLRFRWKVEPDSVVIDQGFLFRRRRVIPRDRVQTVDLKRGIAHRLLGVVEVRIEAIGGADTQGKLDAVDPDAAEELRQILFVRGEPTAPSPSSPSEEVWARVGPGKLVLAGVTGGRVGVMAALVGFFFQFVPEEWWAGRLGRLLQAAPDPTTMEGIRIAAVLGLLVLLAAFLLSVAATVIAHWGFTLSTRENKLEVRRGLLTQHRDTVPFHRIQAVRVEENVVRRLLGLASVQAVVAGRPGGGSDAGTGLLLPIGNRDEAFRVARHAVGLEGGGAPDLASMPSRAWRRRMVRALSAALLAGALAFLAMSLRAAAPWPAAAAVLLAVLLPGLLLARGAYRGLGWADLESHAVVREGIFVRRTAFVPVERLQALETTENPFQRLSGLATLHLRVARPVMDSTPRGVDLARDEAEAWREALAGRVGWHYTRLVSQAPRPDAGHSASEPLNPERP